MHSGIRLGKLFKIEIFLDYSWIVIFAVIFVALSNLYFPEVLKNHPKQEYYLLGFILSLLFFFSSLFHELTHTYVAIKNKVKIDHITLFLFGGISELFDEPKSAEREFKIAVAGPAANLALAIVFAIGWVALARYYPSPAIIAILSALFEMNLILCLFNLFPGFPLDGGRIVRALVWAINGDLKKATEFATRGGQAMGLLLVIFGIIEILIGMLWFGVFMILIGLFINQAAGQNYLELEIREILKGVPVLDLMNKKILTLTPTLSIDFALSEYFIKYLSQSFPVIHNEKVIGLVSMNSIRKYANQFGEDARVSDCMENFPSNLEVGEATESLLALKLMIEKNVSFLPVKREGKIVGMITLEEIASYLSENNMI